MLKQSRNIIKTKKQKTMKMNWKPLAEMPDYIGNVILLMQSKTDEKTMLDFAPFAERAEELYRNNSEHYDLECIGFLELGEPLEETARRISNRREVLLHNDVVMVIEDKSYTAYKNEEQKRRGNWFAKCQCNSDDFDRILKRDMDLFAKGNFNF